MVGIPVLFWLRFGEVPGLAYGLAGFLCLLLLGITLLPGLKDRYKNLPTVKPWPIDALGVVWLLAVPFAPLAAWALTNSFDVNALNWRRLLGAGAGLCVAVPLVCVLPLLRYVRRPAVAPMLLVLAIGTLFPILCGATITADFVRGPQWQDVIIEGLPDHVFTVRGRLVRVPMAWADLSDGRRLERSPTVPLHLGPARVLVLRASARIIDRDETPVNNGP